MTLSLLNLKKINWKTLETYIENNLIIANKHLDHDIWILNYTPKTAAKNLWDDYTISSRGLVIDSDGNILARPFKKFKNIEDYDNDSFPKNFEVFEKIDGFMIMLFYYEKAKEWIVASKYSFISEQAKTAKQILDCKLKQIELKKNHTYIFELIHPNNRVIVDYGDLVDLILLSRIETKNGVEIYFDDLVGYYSKYFNVVKKIKLKETNDIFDLKTQNIENKEGYVIRFENGFRFNIIFEEYEKIKLLINNISKLTIWNYLKNGMGIEDIMNKIPNNYHSIIQNEKNNFNFSYNEIEKSALKEFYRIYHINEIKNRKEFSIEATKSKYMLILYQMFDKKNYDDIIWEQIKPKNSEPILVGYGKY
jgi:hypothetical protein